MRKGAYLAYFSTGVCPQHFQRDILVAEIIFFLIISKQTCKFIFSSAFVISCITEFQTSKPTRQDLISFKWLSNHFIVRLYGVA